MNETMLQGAAGEQAAVEWLRGNGYLIVERNWRCGRYEIDIIAERFGTLHFIEVKTRKRGSLTSAEESIDGRKCRALLHAARAYSAMRRNDSEIQFDLIAVETGEMGEKTVRLVENAIQYGW